MRYVQYYVNKSTSKQTRFARHSLVKSLKWCNKAEGYDVGDLPDDPEIILRMVRDADARADNGQAYQSEAEARSRHSLCS
eukprot:5793052-Amphidinium_carterae.1